jgi:ABC-type branched-subunit amino acid transport system substrate-binding protein
MGARETLRELGRGGVGVVHLARRDGRLVVVKTLRPELARNVAVRRTFFEEARVAALLRHPNVIEVTDKGADDEGAPFIEMEWVPGVTLHAIDDVDPLPVALYVAVVLDLLEGLHAAHTVKGADGELLHLVHRDVSPHNVLVGFDGSVKVLDFGIAKVRDSGLETTTGLVKGKATYLAPEQAARTELDARTDLFAVGIMLWQRLAERRLWEDATEPEIFHRLVEGDIPDLATVKSDVKEPLLAIVRRALAPKKEDRFASAAEMKEALARAMPPPADAKSAIAAHVRRAFAGELEKLDRVSRRRAPTAIAIAVAVALTGGGAWLAFGRTPKISNEGPRLVTCTESSCAAGKHCLESGSCATTDSAGCATIAPDFAPTSRPIWLGAMFPLTGPDADAYGKHNARAAELAVREIDRLGGVPTRGGRRPIGLVSCDDAADFEPRAKHLAAVTIGVTGFRTSVEALALVRDVFVPSQVLAVSALNASPLLAQLPAGDPRLFFRATASATTFATPLGRAVATMLAPLARKRAGLADDAPVRVAVVRSGNATGVAYAEMVMRSLEPYGNIAAREIATGLAEGDAGAALAIAIDTLAAQRPHVVITLSDGMFGGVIDPLEKRVTTPEAERPLYVGATPWEGNDFEDFVRAKSARHARFFAVSWPTSHRPLAAFVERYKEQFDESVPAATASPAPYDAIYLMAYAAAAAQKEKLDGPALSRAMQKLMPSGADAGIPLVAVGPNDLVQGMAIAAEGRTLDLNGVLSRLDFDPATGDTAVDAVLLCTTYDAASKRIDAVDAPIAPGPPRCASVMDRAAVAPR